jgi:hypothetical protein
VRRRRARPSCEPARRSRTADAIGADPVAPSVHQSYNGDRILPLGEWKILSARTLAIRFDENSTFVFTLLTMKSAQPSCFDIPIPCVTMVVNRHQRASWLLLIANAQRSSAQNRQSALRVETCNL